MEMKMWWVMDIELEMVMVMVMVMVEEMEMEIDADDFGGEGRVEDEGKCKG